MKHIIDVIYHKAMNNAYSLQTWPGHFMAKRTETEIILGSLDFQSIKRGIGLEIGCGNAFQSVLIANFADKLVAADLFAQDGHSHTVGINKAKKLIDALDSRNVTLVSCSSTALPFCDNYFDFVFSSSSLEHVQNKALALREMKRVLKPGGDLILIVPTHMPSIYAFPHVFLYFLARGIKLVFGCKQSLLESSPKKEEDAGQQCSLWKRFRKNHPSFPLPEPHGSYRNISEELLQQLPFNWKRLIRCNGFMVKDSIAICLFPWLLLEPFSTIIAAKIFVLTKGINIRLAALNGAKYLSYLVCITARKVVG